MHTEGSDLLKWSKSSYSGGNGCVETAQFQGSLIAVRDSKDPDGGFLLYNGEEWRAFLKGVRAGEFDHLAPFAGPPPSS